MMDSHSSLHPTLNPTPDPMRVLLRPTLHQAAVLISCLSRAYRCHSCSSIFSSRVWMAAIIHPAWPVVKRAELCRPHAPAEHAGTEGNTAEVTRTGATTPPSRGGRTVQFHHNAIILSSCLLTPLILLVIFALRVRGILRRHE